jgi:soluble lytic murein transglycosylase-like protein
LETGYKGPFDFDYNPYQTSHMGAQGPMQIITRWAHPYAHRRLSEKELRTNIDLNVKISMQMLQKWYQIHGDWTLATGAYNSGSPIRNDYAVYASSNKDYKNKWVRL